MFKLRYLVSMALIFTLLVACSTDQQGEEGEGSEPTEDAKEEQFITIATGDSGGAFYALGGALSNIYSSIDGVTANSQSTEGSVVNLNLVEDDRAQVAFSNNSIAHYAANGTEMFEEKLENILAMADLYPMYYHLVVTESSGIESVADLKGKKIAVGPQGSGTEVNTRQLLEGWNLTYDDVDVSYISFSNAVEQMRNRTLDGAFIGAGAPTAAVMDLMTTGDVKLIPLDNEVIAQLAEEKYPFMVPGKIPAGTYTGQEEDVETLIIGTTLVVNKNLSEDVVYEMTKALYENVDQLIATHSSAEEIELENGAKNITIDIHPGAIKYFEENNVELPAHAQ